MHTPPAPPEQKAGPARRRLGGAGIALIALPFLSGGWLLASEGGLRVLAAAARWALPALQGVEVVSGSLLSSPRLRNVSYDDGSTRIEADTLLVEWTPRALFAGRLEVARLGIDSLRVASTSSGAPPAVPASLALPLAIHARFGVGRIVIADHAQPDIERVVLTGAHVTLDSDGAVHRFDRIALTTPWGALAGQMTLGGDAPFALSGELAFTGADYAATATASGALAEGVAVDARARGHGLSGQAQASVRPFALQPLVALRLALDEFDPQRLHAAAPSGRWTLSADLAPRDGDASTLVGPLHAVNRAPGHLDRTLVPVSAITAQMAASASAVDLRDLLVTLTGGGEIRGEAGWRAAGNLPLHAALTLRDVDTAALHGKGVPTRLSGRIDVSASGERQQFELDLADRGPGRIALNARGVVVRQRLTLEHAQVAARGARASAAGTRAKADGSNFRSAPSNRKASVSSSISVPAASLSASFSADGRLQPRIDVRAALDFAPSTLMGEPLAGALSGRLQGTRLSDADISLDWSGNRLVARGAFGGASGSTQDALDWTLDAPRLGALRALTGLALAGRVSASGRLAGRIAAPHGTLKLEARSLVLGDLGSVARADVDAELAPAADGRLHVVLDAADLRHASLPAAVESVRIDIDGTRHAHLLSADVQMAEQKAGTDSARSGRDGDAPLRQSVKLAARGALGGSDDGPSWSGTLDRLALVLSQELAATLAAPARLSVSRRQVALDDAALALTGGGEVRLTHAGWTPDRLDASGRARGFPLRLAWRDRASGLAVRAPLKLGADWSLRAALTGDQSLEGRVALFRESGNVVVTGESRLDLAITEARLQADFAGHVADVSAVLSGPDLGDAKANVRLAMRRDGSLWPPDVDAPLSGDATLNVSSLAWIGRALRLDMNTAGSVKAGVQVAGRLRAPELSGRIDGDGLAFSLGDAGLKLARGQLRARFAGDRLQLENLSFESDNVRPPKDARLDAARLTREPGRLSASGTVDIATARADIALDVRRFAPLQGGDHWLMLSGDGTLRGSVADGMKLQLGLVADAGLFTVPEQSPPALGDDVVIRGRKADATGGQPLALLIDVDLGERLFFKGRGLDTRLAGKLALRDDGRGLRATGNISAVDGHYRAYGQNLDIETGVISFQGSATNPGLNVRAIRPDLPVQAGVEVTGTVQRPRVRLVSDTAMPDSEKLSWIVLGRGQDSAAGSDLSLLAAAAGALLGGEGITGSLAQALGLDQIALTQTTTATGPRSQVVSSPRNDTTVGGQVVSVGKRLSSNALLTYEQGVAGATSVVKLTWHLTRHLALIGSTGTEQAVDVRYVFSFK